MAGGIDLAAALKEKMGPFPTWVWLTLATGGGLGWYLWEQHKAAAAAASSSDTGSSPTEPSSTASQSTIEGQQYIPDYVFQNYNEIPPSTPPATSTTTVQPGGPEQTTPPPTTGVATPPPKTSTPPTSTAPAPTPKPGAVTDLRVTKTTPTSVSLAWHAATNATGYTVQMTYQTGTKNAQQKSMSVGGTSATMTGLTPDHTYTMHVTAKGKSGNGPTAQVTAKTPKS